LPTEAARGALVLAGVALGGLAASAALTPAVRAVARARGWVARPRQDRWHQKPTALLGGVAIYLALALVAGAALALGAHGPAGGASAALLAGIAAAATVMFATGVVDDLRGVSPLAKLACQGAGGMALVAAGLTFQATPSAAMNALWTVIWFVALTNAVNLLDNMDGVAAGVTAVGAAFLGVLFVRRGDGAGAVLCFALVGVLAGYLVFNRHPASIFMGDSGSLLLGALLAGLGSAYTHGAPRQSLATMAVPVLVAVVPVFDTALVSYTRTRARYSLAQGGRDHVAHRLVAMGFGEPQTAWLLYGGAALAGAIALSLDRDPAGSGAWMTGAFAAALVVLGAYLSRLYEYSPDKANSRGLRVALLARVVARPRVLEALMDAALFAAAYSGAYLLRYDGALPAGHGRLLGMTLAVAVVAKAGAFAFSGVYRSLWHQPSMAEVHRIVRATLLGELVTVVVVVFLFRNGQFSRSVFILDALLVALLAVGARTVFRSMDLLRRSLTASGRPALVYGVGRRGELVLRELAGNPGLHLQVVGLVDDDPEKRTRWIHGVPVLGGSDDVAALIAKHRVQTVVLASPKVDPARLAQVLAACRATGAQLLRFDMRLDPVSTDAPARAAGAPSIVSARAEAPAEAPPFSLSPEAVPHALDAV
jgi:UDP-GlcNAc:undecaprenyl-phosphate GlcNAc-1-phosphate transferase